MCWYPCIMTRRVDLLRIIVPVKYRRGRGGAARLDRKDLISCQLVMVNATTLSLSYKVIKWYNLSSVGMLMGHINGVTSVFLM